MLFIENYHIILMLGVLDFLLECRQKYGSVFKIWVGFELTVFYTDPDDARVSI